MTRALYFDLDGTLLQSTRDYGDLLAAAFRRVEGESRDEWLEAYDEAFFERFSACQPEPSRWAFATVSDRPDALAETLHELEVAATELPAGTREDLAALGERYRLGVLSNGMPEWQRGKLRAHDLEAAFDAVVTSYDAGAHKPDAAPFALAERELPADAYAMVGDSDADVEGAEGHGWAAVRYEGGRFRDVPAELGWE